ncbi:MAG TPA: glyoxalase [Candidatus Corynebacterium avicola]|uniref:Glyoxalase n=1 Tax=Candidatus Corynebacterium avicola TaxID=2838527 RepID=A0A9D1UN63_9CORY|nr:glyoxalase [Candidatus Corynebacterium avicola]
MSIGRIVPNHTVSDRAALERAVEQHRSVLPMEVLMDHGWIVTLGDDRGHQVSIMTTDASAPVNPDVSCFLSTRQEAEDVLVQAQSAGAEIVHPLTEEPWGVVRFFYRDATGLVINVGTHR